MTIGAGLVHAAAAGGHAGDGELVLLFAIAAVVQVAAGLAVVLRPERLVLGVAAAANVAAAAAWTASRVSGLPVVDSLAARQPIGLQDGIAVGLEVIAVVAVAVALRRDAAPAVTGRLSPLYVLALAPAVVGMAAPHSHPEPHFHGEGSHALAADPMFSGADTSHVTAEELEAAKALIVATRDATLTRFPDEAAVVAAGYRSIGDGRFPGTYEHFVHAEYLSDGRELDPEHVESIVLHNTLAGKRVASAMYILELGKTMDDVPDIAGELTVWHDHQNLCWDDSGTRLAGLVVNGRCVPRGTFRATPPMLHVWLQEHPCGPFAGIDGHGEGCTHDHAG